VRESYDAATDGWVGNGPGALYDHGALGPRLVDGGSGEAEWRYLDALENVTRAFMAGSAWSWTTMHAELQADYYPGIDEADHRWLGFASAGVPGVSEELRTAVEPIRARAWQLADLRLGALMDLVARDSAARLWLAGDHGMRPLWRIFHPNVALREAGLLAVDDSGKVDARRTRALAWDGLFIMLNRTRWRDGTVKPDDASAVLDSVEQVLRAVRGLEGEPVVTEVWRVAPGDSLGRGGPAGGDLYFRVAPGYDLDSRATGPVVESSAVHGNHGFPSIDPDMATVLCAWGSGVQAGRTGVRRTIDARDAVLDWLGVASSVERRASSVGRKAPDAKHSTPDASRGRLTPDARLAYLCIMHTQRPAVALAFSGGLDTSYCVPVLHYAGYDVHTVFVNTGGSSAAEREAISRQAVAVGAAAHHEVDARAAVFDRFVRFLIQGNVLRGEVYPLSVAAERTQQAISVIEVARQIGAAAVAHGSTGAGNDQIRFDIALRVLAPELGIITPIREKGVTRDQSIAFLQARNLPVPAKASAYSINRGLWGTTWGGGWTHDTWAGPPAELIEPPADAPAPAELVIGWETGTPVSLEGQALSGAELVDRLGEIAESYGIGRAIHVGETALGIKGRIGFEAGAALLLISAHRELEKLVLTRWQTFWKDQVGRFYGDRLHEGHYFDPALRDIEAMITSSQQRVTGDTRVRLWPGRFQVVGARSPFSMMDPAVATYGEENRLWTGEEARDFARVSAIPSLLAVRAASHAEGDGSWS
jgi:argininosuccinate synthase